MLCRLGNGFSGETSWRGGVLFDIIFFEKARCVSHILTFAQPTKRENDMEKNVLSHKTSSIIRWFRSLTNCIAIAVVMMSLMANATSAADSYIESSGVSGISTGYHLKPSTRIEVDFELTDIEQTNQARLFGADYNNVELKMSCCVYISGDYLVYGVGTVSSWAGLWMKDASDNYLLHDTDRHTAVFDFQSGVHRYVTDGSDTATIVDRNLYTEESTQPIALFATKNATGFQRPAKMRIYGVKIYESGVLVHDFVPCVRDGIVGFKDVHGSGGFICNPAAETSFSAGGDVLVETSPYVATPANNSDASRRLYLDTHYYATANTRLELDYALTDTRTSGDTWYLFSGSYRFCGFLNNNGMGFCLAGDKWVTGVASAVANLPGVRRTIFLDGVNEKCGVITAGYTNAVTTAITNANYASTRTIKLSANDNPGSSYYPSMKIYGCRIYESGTMVRDFRPCVIGPSQDGSVVVGMKDELTGIFAEYPNATSEKRLTCGGVIQASPYYVESLRADNRYIDTGYAVTENTKVALDYAPSEARGAGDTWYLFGGAGTKRFVAVIQDGGFGFSNDSWNHLKLGMAAEASYVNVRRTIILDNPAALGVVMTKGVTNLSHAVDSAVGKDYGTKSLKLSALADANGHFASIRIYGCKIWEKENGEYVLKRDYVPAVVNGVAGLQDILPGGEFRPSASSAASPLAYGGLFPIDVGQTVQKLSTQNTATLMAYALGATSYRWTRNGETIDGENGEMLTVEWRKGPSTDTYQAIAQFTVDDMVVVGEPSEDLIIENLPAGICFTIR